MGLRRDKPTRPAYATKFALMTTYFNRVSSMVHFKYDWDCEGVGVEKNFMECIADADGEAELSAILRERLVA